MHIIKYLKQVKLAVLLIVLLLVVQAFTDLSLPRYTANIVDIGIQQSGVEHASPQEMRDSTFDEVCMLSSPQDEQTIRDAYDETDKGTYELNDTGKSERDDLDAIISMPLVIIEYADQIPDLDINRLYAAYSAGMVTKDQVQQGISQAAGQMDSFDESMLEQQAIQATISEYEALGIDMGQMQLDYLLGVGLIMVGLTALGVVVSIIVAYIGSRAAAKIGHSLRSRLFSRVLSFSDAEIGRFSAASLITRGTNDVQQIQMVLVFMLRMLLYAPILAIGGIIMVSTTNAAMSWIIVLAVVILVIVVAVLFIVAMPKFKVMQSLIDRVNLVSREILNGLSVIRAFGRQPHEEERFDEASTVLMKNQLFVNRAMSFMFPLMMLIMNGISVLIVWVAGGYIDDGTIQTGDMIAFITYAMFIIMSFLMISMMAVMLPRADVAAQRINEVVDTQPTIHDPEKPLDRDIRSGEGAAIEFDKVSFAYPDAPANVLTDISFTAEAGKTTAFIGSTGSGKSTILKLVERFYDVTQGSITLDGVDIRELSQKELRRNLGYVPQKAFLFSGTIQSNIAYSNGCMRDADVERAAEIAQSTDFIEAKDDAYESSISQGGTNVSGGQRQRLAIARALASEARAYLFDDSFSALDFKTDAALRQAMNSQLKGKTVLIVAQRISTIMQADKIVVLDDGRIVGTGTHKELMEGCETYKEIATSQLSVEELMGGDAA